MRTTTQQPLLRENPSRMVKGDASLVKIQEKRAQSGRVGNGQSPYRGLHDGHPLSSSRVWRQLLRSDGQDKRECSARQALAP